MRTAIRAGALQCRSDRSLDVIDDALLLISAAGRIEAFGPAGALLPQLGADVRVRDARPAFLIPGLIDAHVHLPQFPCIGQGADELLPWLERTIFPTEARFTEPALALAVARSFFAELRAQGTTTCFVYGSLHTQAVEQAFVAAEESGLRVILGKVLMDSRALGPDVLFEDADTAFSDILGLIERWHGRDSGRLQVAMTPRFALSCTAGTLRRAAKMAEEHDLFLQTHLAENPGELKLVAQAFPASESYTSVYEAHGLLRPKSLFAHGIYLSNADRGKIARSGSCLVHCPASNRYLQSGVFGIREAWAADAKVALGTDIAGGYHTSMLLEAREALETSKTWNLFHQEAGAAPLSAGEALYLATLGGAEAVGFGAELGSFAIGKQADYVLLDDACVNPSAGREARLFQGLEERFRRLLYAFRPEAVTAVAVRGKVVAACAP